MSEFGRTPPGDGLDILRVAGSVYPEVPGGVGLHVHHLSRMQADRGHDVTVLTSDNGRRDLPRRETRAGYELVRFSQVARPFDNSITPTAIPGIARRLRDADVLHVHSHLYFIANVAAVLGQIEDTPLLVTNHGLISQTAPKWLQTVHFASVGRFTLNAADRVLCYTETDRQRLLARGTTSSIHVVPNGVDCTRFQSDPTVEPRRQLVFVGRLKEGKGVEYLVEAFGSLVEEYPDLRLKLVGDGPRRAALAERAARHDVSDQVEFTGYLPNTEVVDVYNESLVFILPSLSEGLPRTMLEAMASGLPVVTTGLPQLEPIVDGAGFTVPLKDSAALEERIGALIEDSELRERLGATGQQRVLEEFTWEDTVARTTRHSLELAGERDVESRRLVQR